ncbi:MAG TPA: hypothetical protein VGC92_09870, partial [Phenylobacterium sp.]
PPPADPTTGAAQPADPAPADPAPADPPPAGPDAPDSGLDLTGGSFDFSHFDHTDAIRPLAEGWLL